MKVDMSLEESCFGTITVGERGQIVIPSDARKKLGINPGDKLIIGRHPVANGLVIFKIDSMRNFFRFMLDDLARLEHITDAVSEEASDKPSQEA